MWDSWKKMFLILLAAAVLAAGCVKNEQAGLTETEEEKTLDETDTKHGDNGQRLPVPPKQDAEAKVRREGIVPGDTIGNVRIAIDPGHGGYDPGKIGINQAPEKEINLAIAKLVKEYLEASGVGTVMTREEDCSLGSDDGENRKVRDLKERIRIMEEAEPAAAVSIHQNSYPQEEVRGAQVFYYVTSREGKRLAEAIQNRLAETDTENDRTVKENSTYYLLKRTKIPLVIVECGFLSNREEAEKLQTPEYQEKTAWAVYLGVMDYLTQKR